MQRYHAQSCNSAVNGGTSVRDTTRLDPSAIPPSFSLNSRRSSQLALYKIKCDREPLNSRIGPPDYHPPAPNCPEETLTREYILSGYRETVEGLEEAREISLSQIQTFTKTLILKSREEVKRYYRAINESRAKKRKAGQVYGVPLSGTLLSKPAIFPEQRPCSEEVRKKWIEGLSQPHKRLRSLADQVPHGYRKRSLFEVLIRNNVPLLRATWFIKVTYLNQIRPGSSSISSGLPDKTQFSRSEQWTKDVIDYLQSLLDEFSRSPQMVSSTSVDEPSLQFKWWYVVRILQWHQTEGLLIPSLVIDWVLNQLQEKELFGVLQLLLPIIYGVIETIVLSQSYVRSLVGVAVRFIREPSPGGSDLVDNSRRAYTISALVEMLRYLILAVPDTFVALDCLHLPSSILFPGVNDGNFMPKIGESMNEIVSIDRVVSSIKKCSQNLARATRPGNLIQNRAKTVQELDKTLTHGDVRAAYKSLFENICDVALDECWIAEVSPCLRSSLKYIGTVPLSLISSVFFVCEWATCDYKDFRTAPPDTLKFSGKKDFSEIYIAMRLLKLKMRDLQSSSSRKDSEVFESPGPIHDIIVCWIDQHEVQKKEGFRCLQLLIAELIRAGVFYPQVYVRQLIVSGVIDVSGGSIDEVRWRRHYKVLKQFPGPYVRDALEESGIAQSQAVSEAITTYSNERHIVLNMRKHVSSGASTTKRSVELEDLKSSISLLLRFPCSLVEETRDCEDCRRVKRQKLNEERCSSDENDIWWIRKGTKSVESFRADPPPKPVKQTSRGRQKIVRKTQSLAQLAAARIEGSQSASTSHVCDIKACCPHHPSGGENDLAKSEGRDVVSIGKVLKKLRLLEKRTTVVWLINSVKQLFEEAEKVSTVLWKVREDDLSAILYLMDVSNELVLSINFLLWLLPKVLSNSVSTIHGGKNVFMFPKNVGNNPCEVGEGFLLSCIRRYENIIVSMDLIPETLSALMGRAAATTVPNGRVSVSPSLMYARHFLKKYGNVDSVVEWEKRFKLTCDKRLVSELLLDGEHGFPLGVPAGVEDLDNFFRQKISGVRVSRVGLSMRDIVHRHVDEAYQYCYGKERKSFGGNSMRSPNIEKIDDCYQMAEQIVMRLMECMKQTGGAAQEGDPNLVASAISAIVASIGQVIVKVPESSTCASLNFARRILRVHIMCLSLLKEALGERQSRVFEVALASESCSILAPGKVPRSQFQLSSESPDSITKVTAAVSALVIGAILHGITNLERMVTLFRLKEGLDFVQFVRNLKSNSNGNGRTIMASKVDNTVEVSVHWFRVLVGNCRTVSDGLIVDLLGEPAVLALSRFQRTLPLDLVFPPAYAISPFVLWRPFIINSSIGTRDDILQLYKSLELAIGDVMKHMPFREVCLRDTHGLHDLMALDTLDSQFASMLEGNGLDMHLKVAALLPLRARLFLDALVDCRLPQLGESKFYRSGREPKLLERIVDVLDTLQPAKFHWQWVELRLLLNEQAVAEKLEGDNTSLAEAIRFVDKTGASENESNFIEILLTRLLVRPDAATLFSEVVHLLGRSLEDSMLMQVKWFLGGNDVLFGRKSIRQRLMNIAETKGLSTKRQYWKPWGWCHSISKPTTRNGRKRKLEVEEGEVVEDGPEAKQLSRGSIQVLDVERALIELVLPCVDKSSDNSRSTFANDMIKQMSNIEQQINSVTRGSSKFTGTEGSTTKGNVRKGVRGGNAGPTRRQTVSAEAVPPSSAALRASMSLRMQFLLRLLPIIYADREPVGRNIRHMLASVVLRLLGSRVVHEDACQLIKQEEGLFDCLLLVLHGLLSSYQPSWLSTDSSSGFSMFDREVVESLQNDLDHMHLPEAVRWRIQSAMPILSPSVRWLLSCQPPSVSPAALAALQPSNPINTNSRQKSQSLGRSTSKAKPFPVQQELDLEVDPWTLLEDGAGSGPSSSVSSAAGGSEHANMRASNWQKGAVRVRRTDLTYIGAVDGDS